MTTEDLLKPRYRVIADWPGVAGKVNVGDIFTPDPEDEGMFWIDGEPFQEDKLLDYPHLFRKLEWWEERPEGELPQYLKSISVALSMKIGEVCKVRKYAADIKKAGVFLEGKSFSRLIETMVPSDEEEYNQYIKQQSKQ